MGLERTHFPYDFYQLFSLSLRSSLTLESTFSDFVDLIAFLGKFVRRLRETLLTSSQLSNALFLLLKGIMRRALRKGSI